MRGIGRGLALLVALAAACGSPKKGDTDRLAGPNEAERFFSERAEAFFQWSLTANPARAAGLGFHEFDGQLVDVSQKKLFEALAVYKSTLAELESVPSLGALPKQLEYERQILLHSIRGAIFELEVLRDPWRNPMGYAGALGFTNYISRDYAPVSERAKAIARACEQAPTFYKNAEANLEDALPKTMVETALLVAKGTIKFLEADVPAAMSSLSEPEMVALKGALSTCTAALSGYVTFLEARLPKATSEFAIGEEAFLRMLSDKEGLSITLARLEEVGAADLARNRASLEAAAATLAPGKPLAEAVALSVADKPDTGAVLAEATAQSAKMKQFLIDKQIISIPSDDPAELRETPPFLRWNFAFLSTPGAFETKSLPSFYYITPPDPSWPADKQRDYVASRSDLLFVTIHEVWPGHFAHYLHAKQSSSKIARSFCTYSMSEGWAHYTEEMMWDAGVGDGDPKVHIGQLQNALLRNVRYISAIGLHTKGMTVEESKAMFKSQGLQDDGNAGQQAVRGTFDPGYLNYTLGKLMIRKLHADWKAAKGDAYTIKGFHDEFLRYQCAPVPVIRQMMLEGDSGAAL